MNTFPLVRSKWTNEHIMAALVLVLALYLLPQWAENITALWSFLAVLGVALVVDGTANFLRYRRPICGVSAAVTAAMLQALTPGVPLWGRLLGTAAALILGKHIWGGTGKNVINPALTGVLALTFLFKIPFPIFSPVLLLLPAILLSLPFIRFRPFAGAGLIAGMLLALLFRQELSIANIAAFGVVFWGCLVVTDPVTVTPHPWVGAAGGALCGFIPLYFFDSTFAMTLGILLFNGVSYAADQIMLKSRHPVRMPVRIRKAVEASEDKVPLLDLTDAAHSSIRGNLELTREEILSRIQDSQVFGFGGAAFSTFQKIKTALESDAPQKHLIINGVECDPGLIHDKWLLREFAQEISKGMEVLRKCMHFESVTLAVKANGGLSYPKEIKVLKVPDYYPIGAERILTQKVLGIKMNHRDIPARKGILVLNVQTVLSIYHAVYHQQKADSRYLTVANLNDRTAQVVKVNIGTKIHEVMERVYPNAMQVFFGGGLMQSRMADEDQAIDKTVNFLAVSDLPRYKESPLCSRCGQCTIHCPAGLKINVIAQRVDEGKLESIRGLHAEECIQCGSCSFVCLAGRNLAARMKKARDYESKGTVPFDS